MLRRNKKAVEPKARLVAQLAVRRLVSRYHIDGYIQWPAADQTAAFFEPHAVKYPFFSEFLMTSQIGGLKHLVVRHLHLTGRERARARAADSLAA